MISIKHWISASRPKTLPAAVAPVLAGTALACRHGQFQLTPALLCMGFALLIQIATNFANDYFDFKKGTDNENRKGPKRAVAEGWISPKSMLRATFITLTLAMALGLNLVLYGGYHLIIVGLVSIVFAILYTGGPYPLAYMGLGDIFVLIFFGWVAVIYTYFVQAGAFHWSAFHLGTAVGMLSVNLLLVNNYRDRSNDEASNKKTTVVRFGYAWGRFQHRLACGLAAASTICLLALEHSLLLLVPSAVALLGLVISYRLKISRSAEEFDALLKKTSLLLVLYSISASIVLIKF